jgi:hypothetical protein
MNQLDRPASRGPCTAAEECERLERQGPEDVSAFADAVYCAEGLDAATTDLHLTGRRSG